jgi:hypothetical protein
MTNKKSNGKPVLNLPKLGLMYVTGVYKLALNLPKLGISKELLATQVLPFLLPLMVENSLTPSQFNILVQLIKDMTGRVESEQRAKLEQLGGLQREQQTASTMVTAPGQLIQALPPQTELDAFFSSLGIDTAAPPQPSAAPAPSVPTPSALSLEDKQRWLLFVCLFILFAYKVIFQINTTAGAGPPTNQVPNQQRGWSKARCHKTSACCDTKQFPGGWIPAEPTQADISDPTARQSSDIPNANAHPDAHSGEDLPSSKSCMLIAIASALVWLHQLYFGYWLQECEPIKSE